MAGGAWGVTVKDDWTIDPTPGGDAILSRADMISLLADQGGCGALVASIDPVPVPVPVPVPS